MASPRFSSVEPGAGKRPEAQPSIDDAVPAAPAAGACKICPAHNAAIWASIPSKSGQATSSMYYFDLGRSLEAIQASPEINRQGRRFFRNVINVGFIGIACGFRYVLCKIGFDRITAAEPDQSH
jgi:hypothetical protein